MCIPQNQWQTMSCISTLLSRRKKKNKYIYINVSTAMNYCIFLFSSLSPMKQKDCPSFISYPRIRFAKFAGDSRQVFLYLHCNKNVFWIRLIEVTLHSIQKYFVHMETWPMRWRPAISVGEESLPCHPCCDTGPRFFPSHPKRRNS